DHTVSLGVYFSDPDGNGLEVYYELPRSQWKRERPFTGATQEEKGRFPGPWDEVLRPTPPAATRALARGPGPTRGRAPPRALARRGPGLPPPRHAPRGARRAAPRDRVGPGPPAAPA